MYSRLEIEHPRSKQDGEKNIKDKGMSKKGKIEIRREIKREKE